MSLYDDPTGGGTPDPNQPPAPGTQTNPPAKRYNTTPNWQDALNPPSPNDPYWAEWIAANPDYRGQGYTGPTPGPGFGPSSAGNGPTVGPGTPPPTTGGGTPPPTTPPPTVLTGGPHTPPTTPPPTFNPPTYTPPPAERVPDPFHYADFKGPTLDDLFADDGYKFRLQQGTDAIQHSAAARGVLNTGGTLKDILGYGQDLASNEYQNIWNRDKSTYDTNRANAYQDYTTNWGINNQTYKDNYQTQYVDPFDRQYQGASDQYNSRQHNYDQNRYYDTQNSQFDRTFDFNNRIQDYYQRRTNQNDDFYRRYTLLGLL